MIKFILVADAFPTYVANVILAEGDYSPPAGFKHYAWAGAAAPGWLWDGSVVTDPNPPEPPLTKAIAEDIIESYINAFAQSWGYTDMARAVGYVGDPNRQFHVEGVVLRNWRSAVWVEAIKILNTFDPLHPPTIKAVLALLPVKPTRPNAAP
jgi:hypothetical protein